ncbi:hypothetical protein SPRG_14873 [Saprolegnia parasitica CBS 223.65]|uniref:RING-type domain-containing protein n=1 Tax=Saprolegnia parasitica (strain CBS 223.65) TaxID=695850 RepID=A0A067BMC3_SAPPC|nr:hypothetical protein SPRG_14873 [Saprolegnia parasitica CBS 223.65]KDO19353.1 hypothetical protein SPRG_14873 [Saprolegnia parasitica CBS 223.65]|eukprot:XP_012209941.1 hypothetical protein SPRG_14873 [Saprolegnia parasitica CBS 223.65]
MSSMQASSSNEQEHLELVSPLQIAITPRLNTRRSYDVHTEYVITLLCPLHKVWWDVTLRHSKLIALRTDLVTHANALRADPEYVRLLLPVLRIDLPKTLFTSTSHKRAQKRVRLYQDFFFALLHTRIHLMDPHRSAISEVRALVQTVRKVVVLPSLGIVLPLERTRREPTAPVATMNEILPENGPAPSAPEAPGAEFASAPDLNQLPPLPEATGAPKTLEDETADYPNCARANLVPVAAAPRQLSEDDTMICVLAVPLTTAPDDSVTNAACPICLVPFGASELCQAGVIVVTSCKHLFHAGCIGHWIDQATSCPLCRVTIDYVTGLCSENLA